LSAEQNIDSGLIEEIIRDCFWGDYSYSTDDIIKELASGDERFRLFLFTKILNNSRYPSRYIRALFDESEVRFFLSKIPQKQGERASLRRQLVRANVLGELSEIQGLKWRIR